MSDRGDRTRQPKGRHPEGVRIIGADEAQAALEAGEAAGRKPGDQLRFGDVPPAPSGPRPAHRFPLPDSVDPAEAVPRPPLAAPRRAAEPRRMADDPGSPGGEHFPSRREAIRDPLDIARGAGGEGWDPGDRTAELGVPAPPPPPAPEADQAITVSGGGTDLPHWTDPPTGEVPRIFAADSGGEEDDLEAWRALGSRGIRWRDSEEDWDSEDEIAELADDEEPVGALDQTRSEHSDLYSFDEDFERVTARDEPEPEPVEDWAPAPARRSRSAPARPPTPRRGAPRVTRPARPMSSGGGGDMTNRVVVGIALVVVLGIAYAIGAKALLIYAAIVILAAAAEGYGMLQRAGFRPATLLGLIGTAGVVFGAYWKGIEAIPVALVLVFAGTMMWYVLGIVEARPLANVAVTTMVFVWIAVLGAFASVMLAERHGKGLFLGAVLVAVAADVVAFLVGTWIGSRPIAESISPNKTVEGFIGGLVGALVVGAIIGKELTPWGGMRHGLVLGLVVGLIAPAGDLFESMMKRDLGVKDSGSILPGHGGLLDRFDSILLALPAAYYVASVFKL